MALRLAPEFEVITGFRGLHNCGVFADLPWIHGGAPGLEGGRGLVHLVLGGQVRHRARRES